MKGATQPGPRAQPPGAGALPFPEAARLPLPKGSTGHWWVGTLGNGIRAHRPMTVPRGLPGAGSPAVGAAGC